MSRIGLGRSEETNLADFWIDDGARVPSRLHRRLGDGILLPQTTRLQRGIWFYSVWFYSLEFCFFLVFETILDLTELNYGSI